ncbi:MAG: sugar nucleotide-binding protein [Candidatus Woesearchaeota archaeon]
MKILIIGASSYVGASIYLRLKEKYFVIGTYNSNKLLPELEKLDITNQENINDFIKTKRPDVIIHVAAIASGGWCEKNTEEAITINKYGTKYLVDAANTINSKIILISSFAVADKESIYGKTKIASEEYVKEVNAGYIILRPSLIVGLSPNTINDRPFNRFLKNITEKIPAVYDTSWKFQPTWLKHIVDIIETILERGINNEIIPISVPELKNRYEIAKDILIPFGIKVLPENKKDLTPTFSEKLNKLEELKLPKYSYNEMIKGIIQEIKYYLKN